MVFVSSELVRCVAFDPQKPNILASCSHDKTIKIWNIESGACQSTLRVDAGFFGVQSVSFSPKGDVIAAGCSNGKIYLVDALAGEVKSTLTGHDGYVPAFPCSACIQVVVFAHYPVTSRSVYCVGFDPSGKKLVSGSSDETVKVWSVGSSGTFECESTLTGHRYVPSL